MQTDRLRQTHVVDSGSPDWKKLVSLPNAISLPAALSHLKGYRDLPINGAQAVAYLRQFDADRSIYRLYRKYFPLQWACSTASLSSACDGGYSPRESEFVHLVDRHLFPIDLDYILDLSEDGTRFERIELLPYAPRWWDEEGEFALGWVLLILVSGLLYADDALHRLDDVEDLTPRLRRAISEEIQARPEYSLALVRELCWPLFGPLAYLPAGLSMLLYTTGNEWLDVSGNDGSLPFDRHVLRWCEQDIELLRSTFRQARVLEDQAQLLVDWLEADCEIHMWHVLTLLRQAR